MTKLQIISLAILFIELVTSNDQLINFVPDTEDFDLIASESIADQYSQVFDLTSDDYLKECLEAHNEKRRLHGSEDLVYDEKLLNDAKEAAFQSALNEDSPYGENLAVSTKRLTCSNAVNLWYKQNIWYNYHVPLYTKETGGFTQIVWRDTKRFACAQARLKTGGSRYFTVCVYDPFGNVSGQFRANVSPPILSTDKGVSPMLTTKPTIPYISTATTSNPTSFSSSESILTVSENSTTDTDLHEATLNVSPLDPNQFPPRNTTLVKPNLDKARLSPGMLVKLKNLNKKKTPTNVVNSEDKIEASESEVSLTYFQSFVQQNTISPTLNTAEISNLLNRNQNETMNDILSPNQNTTTEKSIDGLATTFRL